MIKANIRKQMLENRQRISDNDQRKLSDRIAQWLFQSEIYQKNRNICVYQSFRGEVLCDRIKEMAFQDEKKVYLPVTNIDLHEIEFYQITNETQYHEGAYHIIEPVIDSTSVTLKEPALILMPGLAFDRMKHRIGYGGGYYDRYLERNNMHTTMALCYGFQIVEESLPCFEYDILPDYILTERELIQ